MNALLRRANAPIDIASLGAFRILYGTLMCAAAVRAMTTGWIEQVLVEPGFFFKYDFAPWMPVWSPTGLYVHLGLTALCAALVALGLFYRVAIVGFLIGFSGVQLMDLTNYLNHYYLVVLLGVLLAVMPAHRAFSLDVRRRPALRLDTAPAWTVGLLRFQLACVYVFAALAKLTPDWLLHGQPLGIWLSSRGETPLIGALVALPAAPLIMSWAGFLFDATIVLWLSWRRSRPWAYLAVVGFHGATGLLFDIGMFPLIMVAATPLFFDPSWPRRLFGGRAPALGAPTPGPRPPEPSAGRLNRVGVVVLGLWIAFHVLVPLRHYALPGDVLWGEAGMRWSWKVLVRAKDGAVTFHVTDPASGRRFIVSPGRYLQPRQESEMAGQPDLIHQLARHIAGDFAARGMGDVEVRAEARVSLNGRPTALLLDPTVDLAALDPDAIQSAVQPMPTDPPLSMKAR